MPVSPTYPGVYIEEIPSGVRPIVGVATSVGAFVGYFKRGPMDKAVQIFSMGDFEREFGGLISDSEASYAIQQFFLNGGKEAWIVRTAEAGTAQKAAIKLNDSASGGTSILLVSAASEGEWGNNVRIEVNYATTDPSSTFNLIVTELAEQSGKLQPVSTEIFRNLIIDDTKSNDVINVVNDGSKLINIELVGTPAATQRPAQTGTVSKNLSSSDLSGLTVGDNMNVLLNGTNLGTVTLTSPLPTTFNALAGTLQTLIRNIDTQLEKVTVMLLGSAPSNYFLQVKAGTIEPSDIVSFSGGLATSLGLDDATRTNVQQYEPGGSAVAGQGLPNGASQPGDDGQVPDATALIGNQLNKTGLYALENADIFNILCIPSTMNLGDSDANQVSSKANEYCDSRRAFYILDVPQSDKIRDEVDEIKTWLDENATLRNKNAALYYPRPFIADPLNEYRLRAVASSGTLAGLYARTDGERGVWKAPAGTEAVLRGVQKLEYNLTDGENGTLNPLAINCLRNFDVYGNLSWGARTLDGADQMGSQWKYIPVRRLALFLEESLYRGTKWVVFEPNDEPLWAQIRLNAGAFMHRLFRQGAFQGTTPKDAYLVKCDKETTTQTDINLGIVNIIVGFAPLKPAEFVIIKIQQLAGQIQT